MAAEIKAVTKSINDLNPMQIADDPRVRNKFISLYKTFHGKAGEIAYDQERFHFLKRLQENPDLQKCDKLSLYGAFLDVAVSGLSFDPTMKHVSLVKFGSKMVVMYGAPAELLLRVRQRQVKYIDNPVIVFEGDEFAQITENNSTSIKHISKLPRKEGAKMIACYVKITRNDGTTDFKVMTYEELMKIKGFSKNPTSLAWSENGLPGMFRTKTIKHAFNNYPKLRLGDFSKLETEAEGEEEVDQPIDYSLDDTQQENPPAESKPDKKEGGETIPFEELPKKEPSDQAKRVAVDLSSDSVNEDIFN